MVQEGTESVGFLEQNLLLISIVVLVIFGYVLLIIRKRMNKKYLH